MYKQLSIKKRTNCRYFIYFLDLRIPLVILFRFERKRKLVYKSLLKLHFLRGKLVFKKQFTFTIFK